MKACMILALVAFACFFAVSTAMEVRPAVGESMYCPACKEIIAGIKEDGCQNLGSLCSKLSGTASFVCSFIFSQTGLCNVVNSWLQSGVNDTAVCASLGLCGDGACRCGVCNQFVTDRCLSVPNKCPGPNTNPMVSEAMAQKIQALSADYLANKQQEKRWCLDGQCNPSAFGCCLTCL